MSETPPPVATESMREQRYQELALRIALWREPVDRAFPDLFAGVGNDETKAGILRKADEVGLPSFFIGANALEQTFVGYQVGDKKIASRMADKHNEYFSLWELVTESMGVTDYLTAELLCQLLFLGLSSVSRSKAADVGDAGHARNVHNS